MLPPDDKLLWTASEVHIQTNLSERYIWGETAPRGSLACVRCGKRVLYEPQAVREWLARKRQDGGAK